MAGDWIKIQHSLPQKPEVFAIARSVGQNRDTIVGLLVRFWSWCDQNSVNGSGLSLTSDDVDDMVGVRGFAAAMRASGWLTGDDGSLQVPNFERHNTNSAKARALETEAKRLRRLSDAVSDTCPTKDVQNVRPEKRRARGEQEENIQLLKGNRKAIGTTDSPLPVAPVARRLPKDAIKAADRKPLDLSAVDWSLVESTADAVGRKVPPISPRDRRNWMRFAVMVQLEFSEDWLTDSLQAVLCAKETRRTKQAHLYGVLKAKAAELGLESNFRALLRDIEIPKEVWQSSVLGGP